MKLGHAAALALVGWYLMLPTGDETAALSKWQIANTFDRESDCEVSRKEFFDTGTKRMKNAKDDQERVFGMLMAKATCVPTDDPRLKESSK